MNHLIQRTEESYEKMLFRDALKYGFFELQVRGNAQQNILLKENDRKSAILSLDALIWRQGHINSIPLNLEICFDESPNPRRLHGLHLW